MGKTNDKGKELKSLSKIELLKIIYAQEVEIQDLSARINTLAAKSHQLEQKIQYDHLTTDWVRYLADTSERLNQVMAAVEQGAANTEQMPLQPGMPLQPVTEASAAPEQPADVGGTNAAVDYAEKGDQI